MSHAAPGSFCLLRFADPALPDMVYAEQLNSATYIDKRAEVEPYLLALERLSLVSCAPADCADILRGIMAELGPGR